MKVSYYILTQSILFLNDETLEGRKKEIYVLMKILKFCTDSDSKSYQVKFAISEVLRNRKIEDPWKRAAAIRDVLGYKTLRGKFSSVHPELRKEGVTKVTVEDEVEGLMGWLGGLRFHRET